MITRLGKYKLEQRLKELEQELQRTYQERSEAAAEGDLRENSAYIFMGERALVLNSQIEQLKNDLKQSVVKEAPLNTVRIEFGHQVLLKFEESNREMLITLVGKNDANLKPGWVSYDSPLGDALMGRQKQDKICVNDQSITILEISIGDI